MNMAKNVTPISIQPVWINFTKSVQVLLVPQPDDRTLDQYLEFRDTVIDLVQNDEFMKEINNAWSQNTNLDNKILDNKIQNALILELNAFSRAVEVAQATEKTDGGLKGWINKLLGRASTVTGSVKDILESSCQMLWK
jgi:hypothetical protein